MKSTNLKILLVTILSFLSITVATAQNFEVDGIYYNIRDEANKTVKVTYKGSSYTEYSNEYTGNVVIPETVVYNGNTYNVTSIETGTFYQCSELTSITIPNSVTSIGNYAFYGCTGLTSVTIPNSVIGLGSSAFFGCTGLTSVTIGNRVTSIADRAFCHCTGLTNIEIPNSVTSIGSSAFSDCI